MAKKHVDPRFSSIDTIVKYGLTGVAASIVAVVLASPAGLGGVVGTSVASSFGGDDADAAADNVYARLPSFPAPVSQAELSEIRARLAATEAALETAKAATEGRIERVRSIAMSDGVGLPSQEAAPDGAATLSQVQEPMLTPSRAVMAPLMPDANLELAALLLAHENI